MAPADMVEWLKLAADTLDGAEIDELVEVMGAHRLVLEQQFG